MAARGTFVFALVLACLCAAGSALALPERAASRTLYVDGDSLAVGTSWYLSTYIPGWTIHGAVAVSRHASQGVWSIEQRARDGLLERVVVVDLGTNDDPGAVSRFAGYVRDVVRAAGPSTRAIATCTSSTGRASQRLTPSGSAPTECTRTRPATRPAQPASPA